MPNVPNYADGFMQFGAQLVVVAGNTYLFKNIKVTRPRRRIVVTNTDGSPYGKVHVVGLPEGIATVSCTGTDMPAPAQDVLFTLVRVGGVGVGVFTYITEEVSDLYNVEAETSCDITFSFLLNP